MTLPTNFVPFREWANASPDATPHDHPISDVYGVTLHWEGPHMGTFPHGQCAGKVRTIRRFHQGTRGWAEIAYSAIVCPHGYVFECRGLHTETAANGTSSIGGNPHWYAVCYMSGQGDPFTDAAKAAYHEAVDWLRTEGGAGLKVNGHRDHHSTECPGDVIYKWLHAEDWTAGLGHAGSSAVAHGSGQPPRMDPSNYYLGAHGPWVTWLGERLVAHGFGKHYSVGPGPTFGQADKANVRDFQRAQGWTGADADGLPGHETLRRLAAAPKKTAPTPRPNFATIDHAAQAGIKGNPAGSRPRKALRKVRDLIKPWVRPGK